MNIIHVSPYFSPHIGGLEKCVEELSKRLSDLGNHVEVYTSDVGSSNYNHHTNTNPDVHKLKAWEFAHTPIIPSLFFKLLSIPKESCIHVHISQPLVPEIVYLISKIRNIPYIAHIHIDIEPTGKLGFLVPIYKSIFLKKVLSEAAFIVVPTPDYVEIMSKKYNLHKTKFKVIPYGVDLSQFKKSSHKLHNPIRLLYVGRLTIQKNIPLLLQSIKNIIDKHIFQIELHIVGDGEAKKHIKQTVKDLKLNSNVVIHGKLTGSDLQQIYSNSDIFILPSVYESFGIVLLEAMASGVPVIVSNIPAVRNVVVHGKTGLLVKPTAGNMSDAIEQLIRDPILRNRLILTCVKEVKKYDWDEITSRLQLLYQKVVYANN